MTSSKNTIQLLPQDEPLIILGDFNTRIGNNAVPGIKQTFNKCILNDNEELMSNLCTFNELRINNTSFDHQDQHKFTLLTLED